MIFSKDELFIILKRSNFKICEHSSFFLIIYELGDSKFKNYLLCYFVLLIKPTEQLSF